MQTLAHHFEEGGWGMYPVLWCMIAVVGITLERAIAYARRSTSSDLLFEIGWALRRGDVSDAMTLAVRSAGPDARIARAALLHWAMPAAVIESAIEAQTRREIDALWRRLPALRAVAGIATLCGLLGTVTGIPASFSCVVSADAASRATMLARGISESMSCTAFGLLVAGLALAAWAVLHAVARRTADELSASGQALRNVLVEHRARLRWNGMRPSLLQPTYRDAR
jgi:biopolymer transport protein ExbB